MNMLQTIQPTISSVELVEIINSLREEGAAELLHKNFLAKIENHPGIQSAKFSADYKDSRGRMQKCYNLPKETQPHWYRDTFKELVRLHLVA